MSLVVPLPWISWNLTNIEHVYIVIYKAKLQKYFFTCTSCSCIVHVIATKLNPEVIVLRVQDTLLGRLPTGDNSPPDKNKAQLLPTRSLLHKTFTGEKLGLFQPEFFAYGKVNIW